MNKKILQKTPETIDEMLSDEYLDQLLEKLEDHAKNFYPGYQIINVYSAVVPVLHVADAHYAELSFIPGYSRTVGFARRTVNFIQADVFPALNAILNDIRYLFMGDFDQSIGELLEVAESLKTLDQIKPYQDVLGDLTGTIVGIQRSIFAATNKQYGLLTSAGSRLDEAMVSFLGVHDSVRTKIEASKNQLDMLRKQSSAIDAEIRKLWDKFRNAERLSQEERIATQKILDDQDMSKYIIKRDMQKIDAELVILNAIQKPLSVIHHSVASSSAVTADMSGAWSRIGQHLAAVFKHSKEATRVETVDSFKRAVIDMHAAMKTLQRMIAMYVDSKLIELPIDSSFLSGPPAPAAYSALPGLDSVVYFSDRILRKRIN